MAMWSQLSSLKINPCLKSMPGLTLFLDDAPVFFTSFYNMFSPRECSVQGKSRYFLTQDTAYNFFQ